MSKSITELINLLGITEQDVLKSILSVCSPCQPGALKQSWNNRRNYGQSPEPSEIWSLYEKYDFRCAKCKSQYRICIDHINDNNHDNNPNNLQVLCQSCNRTKQKGGIKNKDGKIRFYNAFIKFMKSSNNKFPSCKELQTLAGITGNANENHLLKFLIIRWKQKHKSSTHL